MGSPQKAVFRMENGKKNELAIIKTSYKIKIISRGFPVRLFSM